MRKLLLVVLLALASVAQAAVYSLPWGPKPQFIDANGAPMSSGSLLTFAGGSSTPQVSYTDSTGGVANPTTITLNTRGETPNEVWLTGGQTYKFVLKDSSGVTVWTVDNVSGVNDTVSAFNEWLAGPAPTFVSTTSFTLAGDQTVEFHKGRRLKTTNSGGTVYSTITASVFGASTTVTVANDSSVLDSGLSAVSYGIVRASNPSISADMVARKGTAVASAATTDIWSIAGDYVHITGATGPITSFGTAPYAGAQRTLIFDSTPTINNGASLAIPGGVNLVATTNARMIVRADTTANAVVVDAVGFTQSANTVFAGPTSGAVAVPTFRALVPADLSMTPITNALGADVALNNTANYFDGPSVAQGTTGTWLATGSVTVFDTAGAATFSVKLWDGTTVIASGQGVSEVASHGLVISLSGYIASPAGNIRISVRDTTATTGKILFNQSGNSKDATISAIRIQ